MSWCAAEMITALDRRTASALSTTSEVEMLIDVQRHLAVGDLATTRPATLKRLARSLIPGG